MEALGAELRMVPSDGGKVTPDLFERFKKEIAVLANEPDTFWTDHTRLKYLAGDLFKA